MVNKHTDSPSGTLFPEGTRCGSLEAPRNGKVELLAGTEAGSTAVYTCDKGFLLEGSRFRQCLESGKWSEEEPFCAGKKRKVCCVADLSLFFVSIVVTCGLLGDPANGKVELLSGVELGDSVKYSCDLGYQLVGEAKRQCSKDGTWSGEEPVCTGELSLDILTSTATVS